MIITTLKRWYTNLLAMEINLESSTYLKEPKGIAEAFIIGEKFIDKSNDVFSARGQYFYSSGFKNHLKSS